MAFTSNDNETIRIDKSNNINWEIKRQWRKKVKQKKVQEESGLVD